MFEYDRDLSVRHAPFTTWECLWDSGPQSLPVSDQESICESEDLNVNSNWDFPPLGYHPKPPNQTPNPWRRDVKSYSEAITGTATSKVQPREQLELLEMEKNLSADGFGLDSKEKDSGNEFPDSENEELLKVVDTESVEEAIYTCEQCHGEVQHTDDCPTRRQLEDQELLPHQGKEKCYGEFLCTNCRRQWNSMGSVASRAQHCINCQVMSFLHQQAHLPPIGIASQPGQQASPLPKGTKPNWPRKNPAYPECGWVILPVPCEYTPNRDPYEYPRFYMLVPAR